MRGNLIYFCTLGNEILWYPSRRNLRNLDIGFGLILTIYNFLLRLIWHFIYSTVLPSNWYCCDLATCLLGFCNGIGRQFGTSIIAVTHKKPISPLEAADVQVIDAESKVATLWACSNHCNIRPLIRGVFLLWQKWMSRSRKDPSEALPIGRTFLYLFFLLFIPNHFQTAPYIRRGR